MFQLQHVEPDAASVAGMELVPIPVARQPAKFDLTLSAVITDGAITCDLNYPADLFAEDGIVQQCEHFRTLSASAVSDPDRCVSDLPRAPVSQHARVGTQVGDSPPARRAGSDPQPATATQFRDEFNASDTVIDKAMMILRVSALTESLAGVGVFVRSSA